MIAGRSRISLTVLVWLACACTAAAGTVPGGQGGVPQAGVSPTVPAVPDTALVHLAWGDTLWTPTRLLVAPDSLLLGDVLTVGVDLAGPVPANPDSLLVPDQEWLMTVSDRGGGPDVDPASSSKQLTGWPAAPADGSRLVRRFRVYRLDPFRVAVAGRSSPVIQVGRRLHDDQTMAPVRDPRRLGWSPAAWVLWLAGLMVLALAAWWWWRRRKRVTRSLPHAPLPLPGWLAAACGLEDLLASGFLARGEHRLFLDRLAGLIRGYLADRYLIGARQMTAEEIVTACRERAYDPDPVRGLVTVMAEADHARYQPHELRGNDCRRAAADFFRLIADCRLMPEFTPVPVDVSLRAGKAWSYLEHELGAEAAVAGPERGRC